MSPSRGTDGDSRDRTAKGWAGLATGFVVAGAAYLILIDTTSLPELYAGAGVALLAAVGYLAAREQERPEPGYRDGSLLHAWRPMARVAPDVVRVTFELARQLAAPRERRGELRAVPFANRGEGRPDVGRRAVTELAGSLAPHTIVIGIESPRHAASRRSSMRCPRSGCTAPRSRRARSRAHAEHRAAPYRGPRIYQGSTLAEVASLARERLRECGLGSERVR